MVTSQILTWCMHKSPHVLTFSFTSETEKGTAKSFYLTEECIIYICFRPSLISRVVPPSHLSLSWSSHFDDAFGTIQEIGGETKNLGLNLFFLRSVITLQGNNITQLCNFVLPTKAELSIVAERMQHCFYRNAICPCNVTYPFVYLLFHTAMQLL